MWVLYDTKQPSATPFYQFPPINFIVNSQRI